MKTSKLLAQIFHLTPHSPHLTSNISQAHISYLTSNTREALLTPPTITCLSPAMDLPARAETRPLGAQNKTLCWAPNSFPFGFIYTELATQTTTLAHRHTYI